MFASKHLLAYSVLVIVVASGRPVPAGAQPDAIGPDVITADIHDLRRWGSQGTKQSYTIGTISCNIGDMPVEWYAGTTRHPLIGQNMFRLKDGRFEQLGQAWLKWAFSSVNGTFCGPCQNPGSSSLLGVGCSDPYSASLNGSQSGLGPKSVVNPYTGAFPATHATPGTGVLDGRVQVETNDVEPSLNPNARYFVEGQYVAPDDSFWGNLHNNASYREIWITTGYALTFSRPGGGTSQTVRTKPAIEAWKAADPAVSLTIVDVPNDGRIYIAWKGTYLGGGVSNFEFAVQNLNSDRAVGGFNVRLPGGVTVASTGFRDVHYHSGEPFSGADWSATSAPGGVRWDTQSYSINPNANALRWGTLYNFRFDANMPTRSVRTVELTLFKPGTPAALVVPVAPAPLPGDLNCDGIVNAFDIDNFVLAITDPLAYTNAAPNCNLWTADCNDDGQLNAFDIDPFVALLTGG